MMGTRRNLRIISGMGRTFSSKCTFLESTVYSEILKDHHLIKSYYNIVQTLIIVQLVQYMNMTI